MLDRKRDGIDMDWDDLRYLLALHRQGTMSAAAKSVDATVATVSRRLDRLSQAMGALLFVKVAEGWTTTPAAGHLVRLAEDIEADLGAQRNRLAAVAQGAVSGRIAISAPPFVVTGILVPGVADMLRRHPAVDVELRNRVGAEGLGDDDIMVRIGRPDSGRLRTRELTHLTLRMYRSRQAPGAAEGWISVGNKYGRTPQLSLEPGRAGQTPRLTVSLLEQQLIAMRSTGLAGLIAQEIAPQHHDMEPIAGSGSQRVDLWMAHHASREGDPLVSAATSWVSDCFRTLGRGSAEAAPQPS
jgi:DNA-binding transcriptional LysR family regulator